MSGGSQRICWNIEICRSARLHHYTSHRIRIYGIPTYAVSATPNAYWNKTIDVVFAFKSFPGTKPLQSSPVVEEPPGVDHGLPRTSKPKLITDFLPCHHRIVKNMTLSSALHPVARAFGTSFFTNCTWGLGTWSGTRHCHWEIWEGQATPESFEFRKHHACVTASTWISSGTSIGLSSYMTCMLNKVSTQFQCTMI